MKTPRRPRPKAALVLLLLSALRAPALTPTEWEHRQPVDVASAGVMRLILPPETLDAAGPAANDLRLLGPDGAEVPYFYDRALPKPNRTLQAPPADVRIVDAGIEITFATGAEDRTEDSLSGVELAITGPPRSFVAALDVSDDGIQWMPQARGIPIVPEGAAGRILVPCHGRIPAHIRLRLGRGGGRLPDVFPPDLRPILILAQAAAPEPVLRPVSILRRGEFAGTTELTLDLGSRNVPAAALRFETTEPVFSREVTVMVRAGGPRYDEQPAGQGLISRVAVAGAPARSSLGIPLGKELPSRQVVVHVHNGDSPPLALTSVSVAVRPVGLVFLAPAAGRYFLLSGNPRVPAPQYDVAAFAPTLSRTVAATVSPGPLEATPGYHPRETVSPDAPTVGAPIEEHAWSSRREVALTAPGVQELELDLPMLAQGPNEIRIVRNGRQIPYVLERTTLHRAVPVSLVPAPDAARPSVGRWSITLPVANGPFDGLSAASPTRIFQRHFRLCAPTTDPQGNRGQVVLSEWSWSKRSGSNPGQRLATGLPHLPGDLVLLETDNGDNAPLALAAAQLTYPVVRLLFKADQVDGYAVLYGNPRADWPHYDLDMVAEQLLTAVRHPVSLAAAAAAPPAVSPATETAGYVFWGALALVVAGLLFVVAKLAPKAS